MQRIFLAALLLLSLCAGAQKRLPQVYPVLANLNLSEPPNENLDANELRKGQAVVLSFTLLNPSLGEPVKAGTCALQLVLGKKLAVEEKTKRAKLALSDYFSWSISTDKKGSTQITGRLTKDLPADFAGTVAVPVQCAETGTSLVQAQWLDAQQNTVGSPNAVEVTIRKK